MELHYKLFLPFTFTLYLCLHPYFIQLMNVPPGEIYMLLKLCRTQSVVNAGSLFRGTKVTPEGKPYQSPPLQFIPRGKRWTRECTISKASSISTCTRTAESGRDKCDLFSGNISAIWSNIIVKFVNGFHFAACILEPNWAETH